MQCKVPGCKREASWTYSLVPVCNKCRDDLVAEARLFYSNKDMEERPIFESIRKFTPWKKTEVGDSHKAVVREMWNGQVVAYQIKGYRFVIDRQKQKGARVK